MATPEELPKQVRGAWRPGYEGFYWPGGRLAEKAVQFVTTHAIQILNVAGPRESGNVGARAFAEHAVRRLIGVFLLAAWLGEKHARFIFRSCCSSPRVGPSLRLA